MKKFYLIALCFSLFLTSCSHKNEEDVLCDVEKYLLPPEAENVQPIGNDWYIFELKIDGKYHKFLYHQYFDRECITEIQGEA